MTVPVPAGVDAIVERLADALLKAGARLVTAESCTGGLVAAACTSLAGSSAWFDCGFVVYADDAKRDLLGVPESLIAAHGAVSGEVAAAMAEGALARAEAALSVAVTGIAGPSGGSDAKPVGTVWIAVSGGALGRGATVATPCSFGGDRAAVRGAAVERALALLLERLGADGQPTA